MYPVVRVGGNEQILSAAFGDRFVEQITPGVIAVAVAPVFCLVLENMRGAIGSRRFAPKPAGSERHR